jgi:hypothetical protein
MGTLINNLVKRPDYLFIFYLLLFGSAFINGINAQPQKSWQWVRQIGSKSWDISSGVVADSKNNLIVTGSFYDTLFCGSKIVISHGNQDLCVARFDENGILKVMTSAGSRGIDLATCISVTQKDNIVIGGILSDIAIFDKITAPGIGKRLFVAGLDNKTRFTWVSTISVSGDASLNMISTDNQGSIFVSGVFTGSLQGEKQIVTSKGKKDVFLARLDKSGRLEKLYSFGGEEDENPASLSVDALGSLTLSGVFGKSFESGGIKLVSGLTGTKTNIFLIKLNRDFEVKWANVLAGDDYALIASLKHDNAGNLYSAGSFSSNLKVSDTTLVSKGYTDAFLLKYKPDGKLDWAKGFGTWYYDYATDADVDNLGGAILTGSIGDTLSVDSLLIKPVSKDNSALVIQFSSRGKAVWADCISGTGRNFSNGSVLDKQGNLYFTGSFQNIFEKEGDAITSFGDQDVFLAKYYNCPTLKAEISGNRSFCPGTGTELSVKRSFTNVVWNDTINGKYSIIADKPGQYKVKILDKKGCMLTDSVQIRQNTVPWFSLGNDTTMIVSDSLILQAPEIYSKFLWKDYSAGNEYLARPTDNTPGTEEYWLSVTDSLDCNYSDTISIKWFKNNKWVDLSKVQLITYPNPADDRLFWYLKTDEVCQLVAEIADENGRVLYYRHFKQYIPGEVKEISLDNLSSGFYYMRIGNFSSGKNFKTVRVIKK